MPWETLFSLFLTLPPLTIGWSPSSPGPLSRPGAKLRPGSKVKVTLAFFGKTAPVSPSTDQSESNAKHYKIKAWERSETNVNISKRPFMRYNLSMSTKVCVKSGSYFKNVVCLSIRLLPSFLLVPTLYWSMFKIRFLKRFLKRPLNFSIYISGVSLIGRNIWLYCQRKLNTPIFFWPGTQHIY